MTKKERAIEKINKQKDVLKGINQSCYSVESFIDDAESWVKAISEGRMTCVIPSVSASGMSRKLKFNSTEKRKGDKRFYIRNYYAFLSALGYKHGNSDAITVGGCGMDMVFATNYSIIHVLERCGIINKDKCKVLCQKTPSVI
jgi:hypothetical protein